MKHKILKSLTILQKKAQLNFLIKNNLAKIKVKIEIKTQKKV